MEPTLNTVTITIEEYMDLRTRADTNTLLMNELGRIEARFADIDRRLYDMERREGANAN